MRKHNAGFARTANGFVILLTLSTVVSCARLSAQRPVTIAIDSARRSLEVGQSTTVRATVRDSAGRVVQQAVAWSTDNPAIARVDANGLVTATGAGITGVSGRIGSVVATTQVSVYVPSPASSPNVRADERRAEGAKQAGAAKPAEARQPDTERHVRTSDVAPRARASRGAARSPHFSHISVFYTDFYSAYVSQADRDATIGFLAPRVDAVMSGPETAWKSVNPTIRYFPYALQYEVVQSPGGASTGSLTTAYSYDMIHWYAAHPNYDYESAYLHRGGHDSTHRVAFKNESYRWLINPGDAGSRAYQADRFIRLARGHEGVFLDEFGGPYYGATKPTDEFATGAAYLASEAEMIAHIHAAIAPRILLINIAEYWTPTDSAIVVAGGGAQLERTNYPFGDRTEERWSEIDHLLAAGVYTEFVATISFTEWGWTKHNHPTFDGGLYDTPTERGQMWQLASYYMAVGADPQRLSFDQQNFWNIRPDKAWATAVETDVGHPVRARHIIARGADPKGQSYRIYAREFEHALVLVRPAVDWRPTVYGDDTAIEVPLPKPMRLLHRDGTLGPPVTSVKLRNVDAAIFIE